MDGSTFWLFVAAPWVAVGLVVATFMARRGHDPLPWLALGIAWGPFSAPLAWSAYTRERGEHLRVLREGHSSGGDLDVLAAIDGSAASVASMVRAERLLGPRVGRLRVVQVVDRDTGSAGTRPELEAVTSGLEAIVDRYVGHRDPEVIVATGRPGETIAEMAQQDGFTLIAVGSHGEGRTLNPLGSTADWLTHHSIVPVLVVREGEVRRAPDLTRSREITT